MPKMKSTVQHIFMFVPYCSIKMSSLFRSKPRKKEKKHQGTHSSKGFTTISCSDRNIVQSGQNAISKYTKGLSSVFVCTETFSSLFLDNTQAYIMDKAQWFQRTGELRFAPSYKQCVSVPQAGGNLG